jgi:iron complex outermembrane receptor protein
VIQPVPLSDQFTIPNNNPLFNLAPYNGLYPARFGALAGQPTGLPAGFSTIIAKPGDPFYPTAYVQSLVGPGNPLEPIAIRYRSAVTGNRDITDTSESPRLTFGVKGLAAGWDFDAAFLHSASKVVEHVNNGFPALTKIMPLLNSGLVNFWGPNTPDIDAQLKATNFTGDAFNIDTSITSVAGKASRELMQLPSGPLALAVGAEARKEKLKWDPNPTIQTGDISGYGGNFLLTDKTRSVNALFAEVNVPIVKGLEANAAVRYDHYEGVGNSTTPKLSLRWQPTRSILLRGSVGRGFRAPSLQDLFLPQTTGVTPNGLSDPVRCPTTGASTDCQTQFGVTFGGNPGLKPEKSDNYTLGFVLEPVNNLSIAVDAFKIDLKDTIVNGVTASIILSDLTKYGSLVTRGAPSPAFPNLPGPIVNISQTNINLGETKVAGFDVDLKWGIPAAEMGKFTIGLTGTYFSKYDVQNPDGSFTGGIDQINTATGGVIPRWKHYLSLDWVRGPWNVTLAQNYQGGYSDICGSVDPNCGVTTAPPQVGSYTIYDLQTTYSGIKNLKLTLGAKNIFNTDPPYTNSGGAVSFQAGYDPQYADPRGRFIYGRVTYSIK